MPRARSRSPRNRHRNRSRSPEYRGSYRGDVKERDKYERDRYPARERSRSPRRRSKSPEKKRKEAFKGPDLQSELDKRNISNPIVSFGLHFLFI